MNGFINDGLICYEWFFNLDNSLKFEQLYKSALTRNIANRVLTLSIDIDN